MVRKTPWPNRAETAVRLFKRQWQLMTKSLEDDRFKGVTIREAIKRTVWARNTQLTTSGYSPLEIATGRRPPDLLDIETADPAQLSVEPLAEDRTQQELQRLALKAHQEARQSADLRHDMAKRTLPSDGPYKPGDKVFVWSAPANANSIASKALRKERWIRGTVISQEGSMVNVHVDNAVLRVNQSKIRRDHDEWHDVAVSGLDNPDPVPLAAADEGIAEGDYAEAYFVEQAHWFCQTGKCDVVELCSSNTGLSWMMSRMNMKVGEPIHHKHGWTFNSKTKLYQAWNHLEKLDLEYALTTNPSPNAWRHSTYKYCLEVMKWQISRGKGFLVIMPSDAGFAHFLKRYKLDSRKRDTLKLHLACHYFDMNKYCRCDPNIRTLLVYYNFDYDFHLMEPEYAFSTEGKLWTDPQWKILPSHFCSFLARFTELVPIRDMRQNFLVEDLLEHFDDGTLCGASMFWIVVLSVHVCCKTCIMWKLQFQCP